MKLKDLLSEAKFKKTYPSIKARDKEYNRIWPVGGAPRVTVRSWSEVEKTGRQKVSYIEIDGDKEWIDAYKKIAFNGSGDKGDVIDYVRSLSEGSLPTKVTDKGIGKSTIISKSDPDDDSSDDFVAHHKYHSGPHIDGLPAEDDTIDFDDDEDENTGGLNDPGKDTQKRGYEPVRDGVIKLKDLIEATDTSPQKGDYIHDGRITHMEKILYVGKNYRGDKAGFIQGKEKGATYSYDFAYLKDTGKKKGGKTIWGIG